MAEIIRRIINDDDEEEIIIYMRGGGSKDGCLPRDGEYLHNYTFDCGLNGWDHAPTYDAE